MGRKQKLREKRKAAIAAEELQPSKRNGLYWTSLIGLSILMLYPPFLRGLYFRREFLPTHALSAMLFGLWWIYKLSVKKDTSFLKHPLDYAVLGIVLAYAVSLITAVNLRSALGELLKNINYFIAFWLVAEMTKELKKPQMLLNILLASAALVALLGIGAAAGTFNYTGAFSGGRIHSSLQYPNTLATYLTAAYFISMTLLLNAESDRQRYIYSAVSFTLFFVFIFTYSRGAWLAFPLVMIVYLVGISKGKRVPCIAYFIQVLIPAVICLQGFSSAISQTAGLKTWMWYIAGVSLTIALSALSRVAAKYITGVNKKTAVAAISIGVIMLAMLAVIVFNARQPIMLAHSADESDSTKTVRREVDDIKPDTDYYIALDIESKNPEEKQYSWRIVVQSINDKGETVNIITRTGGETDGMETNEFHFSTMPDTERIRINFYNYYSNTYALYDNINIYEGEARLNPIPVMTSFKYIPESVVQRLSRINLRESSAASRLEFYQDAFKIIKDYPVFGAGGGGWTALYHGYKSRMYWTSEVHSYFIQLWVETGTLGFIVICAVWLVLFYEAFKLAGRKEVNDRDKDYLWGTFIGAFALGAHSVIDFNLSLGAVALYLWFLVGIFNGGISYSKFGETTPSQPKRRYNPITSKHYLSALIPTVLIIAVSLSLYAGEAKAVKGKKLLQEGNLSEALKAYEAATRFDPLEAVYKAEKAQVLEYIAEHSEDDSFNRRAEAEYGKALKVDRYNPEINSLMGFFYLKTGEVQKGFEHIERAIELHPHLIDYYEDKVLVYKSYVEYLIENDKLEEAAEYIQKALAVAEDIRLLNEKSSRQIEMTFKLITDLEKLAVMGSDIGSRSTRKMADMIVFAATKMFDTSNDQIPDFWRRGNSEGGSIETRIIEEADGRALRVENRGNALGYIYTRDFALKPGKTHFLTFKARGNIDPKNFRLYVRSRSGKSVQGSLSSVKVSEEWQEYELEFTTTEDIEPGNQYIRIDHMGNGNGYIDIRDIILTD